MNRLGAYRLGARFRRRSGCGLPMSLRCRFFSLALHLQAVFLQLLRIYGLLRVALVRLRVLRPALAAIWTIAPVAAATAAAAAIAPPAARFFTVRTRRAIAVFRPRVLALLHGRPGLLRRAGRALVRAAFSLWAFSLWALALL
jgi:hypothetical protein